MRAFAHILALVFVSSTSTAAQSFDLVIANGRVMDPESGLDAVRHVGIRNGRIAALSTSALAGNRVIDATNLVVAPGFIDLHEHGQIEESYALMVRDGVTSAFELEVGTGDVAAWYATREPGQIVNYGVSVGHIPARMQVLGDPGRFLPAGIGGSGAASNAQIAQMEALLRKGLREGAVAVGFGSAYTPGATMAEIERLFRVAAEGNASVHIHMRGGVAGLDSTIAAAARARAKLHIVHVNSSADTSLPAFLSRIQEARGRGQDVTTEAYPYGAGMTEIQSALFDDWRSWPESRFALHQLVATGERLNRRTFEEARRRGGTVIIHGRSEEQTRASVVSPLSMIASDGFIEGRRGHPRTSGSYSKVLGKYVREERALSLMEALAKMTIAPARRLEGRVPAMRAKGRIRIGADADLTIFDPATVADRSTYEDATIPAAGIPYVVVRGEVAVDGGTVTPTRAGRAIRAPTSAGAGARGTAIDTAAITRAVLDEMTRTRAPGVAIAVVSGDRIVYEHGFGVESVEERTPITPTTLFRIGSTTKMVTGLTALLLESRGRLTIADPIARSVKGLAPAIGALTLRQLLSHSAGLVNGGAGMGPQDESALGKLVRGWGTDMLLGPTDDIYSYSSPGYWLAGHVIEEAAQQPYADAVTELLLRPLGMERSTFRPLQALTYPIARDHRVYPDSVVVVRPFPNDATTWASGSLFSSAHELGRLAIALLNGGVIDGRQVLPAAVVESLMTPRVRLPYSSCAYTYGLQRCTNRGRTTLSHSGFRGGSGSIVTLVPAARFGVIVLSNRNGGIFNRTATAVLAQLSPPSAAEDPPSQPRTVDAAIVPGVYAHASDSIRILQRSTRLLAIRGGDTTYARYEPPNTLALVDAGGTATGQFMLVRGTRSGSLYLHDGLEAYRRIP